MNRKTLRRVIPGFCLPLFFLSACEWDRSTTVSSNQGDNDYFEEPLSDSAEQYAAALETTNRFVEHFASGSLVEARNLLDPRFQAVLTDEEFAAFSEKITDDFGGFVEYKPMQWSFSTFSDLNNVIVSTKIVVHEQTETFYVLNFDDDGVYRRILTINIFAKLPGDSVSDGASLAFGREQ